MKYDKVYSGLFILAIILFSIIFIAIAIFSSYKFFERNVKAEAYFYSHDLSKKIFREISGEYKRYLLITDIGRTIDANKPEEDLKKELVLRSKIFDIDGDLKALVSSIGYFNWDLPQKAYEYSFSEKKWKKLENVFNKEPDPSGWNIVIDEVGNKRNLFLIEDFQNEGRTLFFRIDQKSFINEYLKDSVNEIATELVFKWKDNAPFKLDRKKDREGISQYKFSPLKLLFRRRSTKKIPLIVEIPAFFNFKVDADRSQEETGEVEPEKEPPLFLNSGVFLEVHHKNGSYFYLIEKKATINFFESITVILIITTLFVLLVIQLQRSRKMRFMEKQFVASVTHELRTPLTVINSAADNLGNGIVPPEKMLLYSELIKSQSARLGTMIEEILQYSRFEGNKNKKSQPEEFNLLKVVKEIERNFKEVSTVSGISIKWNTNGLPEEVVSHPETIKLVTENLLSNAINHAYSDMLQNDTYKQAEIRFSLRVLIPDKIEIIVEDDGRGIDGREIKHIFEPFFRGSTSRSRQEKGSGLGLFIARQKAIFSGGKLIVKSPYKKLDGSTCRGCRFILLLPCFLAEKD